MNSREDILAEINILKIMVSTLWETHYGKINGKEFREFKEEVIKKMKNN
tara:strand:+ start:759 stop:905 length:147 start_codon:yes stop_codon:yes gene_type:complete